MNNPNVPGRRMHMERGNRDRKVHAKNAMYEMHDMEQYGTWGAS